MSASTQQHLNIPERLSKGSKIEVLYSYPLSNVPTHKITALKVTYAPGGYTAAHRHGLAFASAVMLRGRAEMQINDEDLKEYVAEVDGKNTWQENPGDLHRVSRNASQEEMCEFIATLVCPREQEEFVIFDCPACEVAQKA